MRVGPFYVKKVLTSSHTASQFSLFIINSKGTYCSFESKFLFLGKS